MVESMRYDDITRNFYEYVNGCMYLAQTMMDSRTKVDQRQDHQDLMRVRAEFRKQHEELLKERDERKVLEDFKTKYQPEMDKLREGKQKLHDAAARYIDEKNRLENEVKTLKDDLSTCQQKLDDLEEKMRQDFDDHDARSRELYSHVVELNANVDSLRQKLNTAIVTHDDTLKSLNLDVVKLREELRISLEVSEMAGTEKERHESQFEQVRKALADSECEREEAAATDQGELSRLQRELEIALVDRQRENDSRK